MGRDSSPEYWRDYNNLQHTKHMLIKEYLNGWFPKLGLWSGRILYLDTHAGRGRHRLGEAGSPLVALDTFLNHSFRERILKRSEVRFFFVEYDADNVAALKREIKRRGELPDRVVVSVTNADCYEQIRHLLSTLESSGRSMAPAFVFVDPYGFKVPGDLLERLLKSGRVELFVNVIWRELDMAMAQAFREKRGGLVSTLDRVFDGEEWRRIDRDRTFNERADSAVDLLKNVYGAEWATSLKMLGENNATRYVLAHFTNHDQGRDLMKDCIWKICPDGRFYARRSDSPQQAQLITPEPDLRPLKRWLADCLSSGPRRWSDLTKDLRKTLWRGPHLSKIIRAARKEGLIRASDHEGKFSESSDPLLHLVRRS